MSQCVAGTNLFTFVSHCKTNLAKDLTQSGAFFSSLCSVSHSKEHGISLYPARHLEDLLVSVTDPFSGSRLARKQEVMLRMDFYENVSLYNNVC